MSDGEFGEFDFHHEGAKPKRLRVCRCGHDELSHSAFEPRWCWELCICPGYHAKPTKPKGKGK